MSFLLLSFVAAASTPPTWSAIQSASWKQIATRSHDAAGEVVVYSASIQAIPCFMGEASVAVAAEVLQSVAVDIKSAIKWSSAGVTMSETLGSGANTIDYFQYLDVPGWTLASDRFWFLHGTAENSGGTHTFRWERLIDGGSHGARFTTIKTENPGAVEPPLNVGGWEFKPVGSQTRVRYSVCSDVGGSLPQAVQSAATKKTLPDTVGDLVREAKKRAGR